MNLAQARQELMDRGFDYLAEGRLTIMLNDAKNQFEDQWAWPWLEQLHVGPNPLPIPALKHVVYVRDQNNNVELLGLDVRQVVQDGWSLAQTGTPRYWWLDGPTGPDDTVTVNAWPVTPVTLEVRAAIQSPELAGPNETPLIPARYHPMWVDYAVINAYHDSDNFSAAQALRSELNARMQDLITRYEVRNRQHSVINSQYVYSEDE